MPAAIAILAIGLAASVPEAHAVEVPDGGLATGPWIASGWADGVAFISESGLDLQMTVNIPAEWDFYVDADGVVRGTWTHQGEAVIVGTTRDGQMRGDMNHSGSGSVGGTNKELTLDGTSRTTGVVTFSTGGLTFPVDNSHPIPSLRMAVESTFCDEAHGSWAYTVETALEEGGWTSEIGGFWRGIRKSEGFDEHAEEVRQLALERGADRSRVETHDWLLYIIAYVIRQANDISGLVLTADPDYGFPLDELFEVIEDAEWALNTLRNLSDCDMELLGEDNVEQYINDMTLSIQVLISSGTYLDDTRPGQWQQLVQIAARTGAIGAGSAVPAGAARAEQELVDYGSAVLTAYYEPDARGPGLGSIPQNEDTQRVIATGVAMGWTFEVDGIDLDAGQLWLELYGVPDSP
jgi:hypothetical protein